MTHLFLRWEGFHDPHSVIKYYSVLIGTCPGCNNVMTEQTVGVHTGIFLKIHSIYCRYKYYKSMVCSCLLFGILDQHDRLEVQFDRIFIQKRRGRYQKGQ